MATIVDRPRKNGITYQVKWRQMIDGRRRWQSESFGTPEAAEEFKALVDAAGQRWPEGWIPGKGFPPTQEEEIQLARTMPLVDFAARHVHRLTSIEDATREGYEIMVRKHFSPIVHTRLDGTVEPATVANVVVEDLHDWVRAEQTGMRHPDNPKRWLRQPASATSIKNRHILLFSIMESARRLGLREDNPCDGSYLPRMDVALQEEMVFLEHDEFRLLRAQFHAQEARDLVDWLAGTGMRFGEATAIQVRDINLAKAQVTVQRGWRRTKGGRWVLGPPKTRASRRTLGLSPSLVAMCRRLVAGKQPEDLVFLTPSGRRWEPSNFRNHYWKPAVNEAVARGLPRRPRIHDLRHTLVAWLLDRNISPAKIQKQLGHSNIMTTINRYGHLMRDWHREVIAAVEDVLGDPAAADEPGLQLVA